MEESQRSETVAVLTDMSEPLAAEADSNEAQPQRRQQQQQQQQQAVATTTVVRTGAATTAAVVTPATAHPVAVTANVATAVSGTVGVPVSLPVGSIIGLANSSNGTTFNVITSDQLQIPTTGQFKQMLCVDNGFLCESRGDEKNDPIRWNGELKATHIVIQNSADESESDPIHVTSAQSNSLCSWTECANMAVLPIRCKNTNAELHKNRFGSGGRGRCIKLGNDWYTPSEFEALCGRASSKDWKRSIRFGGRSLQTLIDEQILRPHATSCTCAACCDDDSAAGPIRLFTPYKRRRRTRDQIDGEGPPRKHRGENSRDGSNNEDSEGDLISDKGWPTFVQSDDVVVQQDSEQLVTNVQQTENGYTDNRLQKLEDVSNKLLKLAYELKKSIEEIKSEDSSRQQRREQNIVTQLGTRTDVIETVGLQPASDSHNKKCANCNRDAFAECSLCRRMPYCSTFCQRKDWSVHQVECVRDAAETVMLIVESSSGDAGTLTTQPADQ